MEQITVLYFGDLMARLEIGRESLRLPSHLASVAGLMRALAARGGPWAQAFGSERPTLHITVNKRDADPQTPLKGGDEIAFVESIPL